MFANARMLAKADNRVRWDYSVKVRRCSRTMKTTLSILLLICIASVATATDKPKQITKTSHTYFSITKQAVAFVSHLVESDPDVRTQSEKVTAATTEEAGGKFSV